LDRIIRLLRSCRYSFHDLSRVSLDRHPPATPRFNMPFELGLAVTPSRSTRHEWFVFEEQRHRLMKSLSDLNGTDPHIHDGKPEGSCVPWRMPWFGGGIAPPLPNSAPSTRTCVARPRRFDATCGP